MTWDGADAWTYVYSGGVAHHDIEVLPNGNVLMIVRETKPAAEAIAQGRDPDLLAEGELWTVFIIEVEPTGPTSGNIVWEWRAWDHLVQDHDPTQNNFAGVGVHPELIDINYFDPTRPAERDWRHANAVDYNEEFDQIVLSVRHFSEFWVIDHSTTTEEAAGHSGGDRGRGGDLLYRWGNSRRIGPAMQAIKSSSNSTMPSGLNPACPEKETSWCSTTAPAGPEGTTPPSMNSRRPSTELETIA